MQVVRIFFQNTGNFLSQQVEVSKIRHLCLLDNSLGIVWHRA